MPRETGLAAPRMPIEIRSWIVLGVGLGTAAFLAASMAGLYYYYRQHPAVAVVPRPAARVPEPRVQSDPAGDMRDLGARQREQLGGYAWADRERGLVRIPVARAMEILAARGEDAFAPLEPPQPGVPPPVRPQAAARTEGGQ